MYRLILACLILLTISPVLLPMQASNAQNPDVSCTTPVNISQNSRNDERPQIAGNIVVWMSSDGFSDGEIWAYDLNTQTGPVNISLTTSGNQYPDIDGNLVVWTGHEGGNYEIYVYDLSTQIGPTKISSTSLNNNHPKIDGNIVVWYGSDGSDVEIWAYNLSTGTGPINVSQNNLLDDLPKVGGNIVAWTTLVSVNPNSTGVFEINAYDLSTQTGPINLSQNLTSTALPYVDNNVVLWSGSDGSDDEIWAYDFNTNTGPTNLSQNTVDDEWPHMDGSIVVWTASGGGVWATDLSTQTGPTKISDSGTNPLVDGSRIVWSWDGDIWIYDLSTNQGPTNITQNSLLEVRQQIDGDTVVWQGDDGNDYEIWVSTCGAPPPPTCSTDTVGIYRNSDFSWYLRYSNTAGFAETIFNYGLPSDVSIIGDWDGDGYDTVGIRRGDTFYLKNDNTGGSADITFAFGAESDIPVAGDWNGDGIDTIGVYRPDSATWFLRNSNSSGDADLTFVYGLPNETPVVGDWNGDTIDTVGIYRDSDFSWYLRNANSSGFAETIINFGLPSDDAVVGDWNGDCVDTVGIYRSNEGNWYLKNSNSSGIADLTFAYGLPNERGVTGHWLPGGGSEPAVVTGEVAETVEEAPPEPTEATIEEPTGEPVVERQLVTVEADDAAVAVLGTWTGYPSDAASGGSYLYSSGTAGDALVLTFDGSYAELTVVTHPSLGNLVVEVDGVVVTTASLSGEAALNIPVVVGELAAGLHTLRVYPEAEGMVVAVDTFLVDGMVIAPVVIATSVPTETATPAPVETEVPTEIPTETVTEEPTPTETPLPVTLPVVENFDDASDWEFTGNWQPQMDCGYAGACVFATTSLRDTVSTLTYRYPVDLSTVPLGWKVQWTLSQNAMLSVADSVAYEVSTDGGATWQLMAFISDVNVTWEALELDLSAYTGQVVNLRISVNTLVALPENAVSVGYWLDEMQITAFEPLPEPTAETPVPTEETPVPTEVVPTEETPVPTDVPTEIPTEVVPPTEVPTFEAAPTEEAAAEPNN